MSTSKTPDDESHRRLHATKGSLIGRTIGDYLIVSSLFRGFEAIYCAEHTTLGTRREIKVIAPSSESVIERVMRAAQLAKGITHPGLVTIHDCVTSDGQLFVVMELVEGEPLTDLIARDRSLSMELAEAAMKESIAGTRHLLMKLGDGGLRELVARHGSLPPTRVAGITQQIGEALAAIHAVGMVHCDVRPDNIIIAKNPDGSDRVKVILRLDRARIKGDEAHGYDLVGDTPGYMSPEQVTGEPVDGRSDTYSLAAVAFECLTGTTPFRKEGPMQAVVAAYVRGDGRSGDKPHTPAETRPDSKWPPELDDVFSQALQRIASHRTAAPDDFGRGIVSAVERMTERVASPDTPRRLKREEVQFTVYRPRRIKPSVWYPMLAFMHLAERRPDAPPDEASPQDTVIAQAKQLLGASIGAFRETSVDAREGVFRDGGITLVPHAEGVEFNPPQRSFRWVEDVHREDFRLRAGPDVEGKIVRGRLDVFFGSILLADVDLAFHVDSTLAGDGASERQDVATARPYRRIFASYSHKDLPIVRQYENYVETLGDRYLRDARELRSGENWDDRLRQLIHDADVFQLFWSRNSMMSEPVRREWEYALSLGRSGFVRPTFWETPMPESPADGLPPPALRALHFHQIGLALDYERLPTPHPRIESERLDARDAAGPPKGMGSPRRASRARFVATAAMILIAAIGVQQLRWASHQSVQPPTVDSTPIGSAPPPGGSAPPPSGSAPPPGGSAPPPSRGTTSPPPVVSAPPRAVFRPPDFFFDFDKSVIKPEEHVKLDSVVSILNRYPNMQVEIQGHTDATEPSSIDLSFRRTDSVKDYLISQGILASRLQTRAFGETSPVADNGTAAGRALNRRVILIEVR